MQQRQRKYDKQPLIIDMVLPTMDFLLETFEGGVEKYWHDEYMSTCIDAGWKKLTEYYRKADRAPAYIAAIVLDPTKKWAYFRDWEPEWRTSAKQSLKNTRTVLPQALFAELILQILLLTVAIMLFHGG